MDSGTTIEEVSAVTEETDVCGIAVVDVGEGAVSEDALDVVSPVVPTSVAIDGTGEAFDLEEVALVSGKMNTVV